MEIKKTLIIALLILNISCVHYIKPQNKEFSKGLWITANYVGRKSSVDSIISFCTKNNITMIFPQIVVGGSVYFDGINMPYGRFLKDKDAFLYLVRKAHQHNIEVHAWINANLIWSFFNLPPSNHIIMENPNILSKKLSGINHSMIFNKWNKYHIEGLFLDPSYKEFSQYLAKLSSFISRNYNVDGIHLDFIRYAGYDHGFTDKAINDYKKITGINILFLPLYEVIYTSLFQYDNLPPFKRYLLFHRYLFNTLRIKYLKDVIKTVRYNIPHRVKLSAAVFPNPHSARMKYSQDWKKWDTDFIVTMNYTPNISVFRKNIEYEKINYNKPLFVGIEGYWMGRDTIIPIEEAIAYKEGTDGIVIFDYGSMIKKDEELPKYPSLHRNNKKKTKKKIENYHIKTEAYSDTFYTRIIEEILEYIDSPLQYDTMFIIRESAMYRTIDRYAQKEDSIFYPPTIIYHNDTITIDAGLKKQREILNLYFQKDTSVQVIEEEHIVENPQLLDNIPKRMAYLYTFYKRTKEIIPW